MQSSLSLLFLFLGVLLCSQITNKNNQIVTLSFIAIIGISSLNLLTCGGIVCKEQKDGFDPVQVNSQQDDMYNAELYNTYETIRRSNDCNTLRSTLASFDKKLYANDSRFYRYLYARDKDQLISDMYSYAQEKLDNCAPWGSAYSETSQPNNYLNPLNRYPYEQ